MSLNKPTIFLDDESLYKSLGIEPQVLPRTNKKRNSRSKKLFRVEIFFADDTEFYLYVIEARSMIEAVKKVIKKHIDSILDSLWLYYGYYGVPSREEIYEEFLDQVDGEQVFSKPPKHKNTNLSYHTKHGEDYVSPTFGKRSFLAYSGLGAAEIEKDTVKDGIFVATCSNIDEC